MIEYTKHKPSTLGALMDFLRYAGLSGEISSPKVALMRAAINKVFSGIDNWEAMSLDGLKVDLFMDKLSENGELTPNSLSSYKSRIKQARMLYHDFLDEQNHQRFYRPGVAGRWSGSARSELARSDGSLAWIIGQENIINTPEKQHLLKYPFPFTDGSIGKLELPVKLTQNDVERLVDFIKHLPTENSKGGYM